MLQDLDNLLLESEVDDAFLVPLRYQENPWNQGRADLLVVGRGQGYRNLLRHLCLQYLIGLSPGSKSIPKSLRRRFTR